MRAYLESISRRSLAYGGQNPFASAMSVVALTLCLFILGSFMVLQRSAGRLVPSWLSAPGAVAYLRGDVTVEDLNDVVQRIRKWPAVERVLVISREEARSRLEAQLGEWKGALAGVPDGKLPISLEISFKTSPKYTEDVPSLLEKIRNMPQIEDVYHGGDWLEGIESARTILEYGGMGVAGFLALVMVLIASHSVRLTVAAYREELEICHFTGATPVFLRIPFYLEGVLRGLVSALMASGLLVMLLEASRRLLPSPLAMAFSWNVLEYLTLVVAMLACGVTLSCSGTWIALRRSLRF